MIVDSSALVAVINDEPESAAFLRLMLSKATLRISAATYFEFAMVVDRGQDAESSAAVDILLAQVEAEVVPVTADTARLARDAYRRFGKGNHPARLNFGDCFAYALAMELGEPLLFKGADFAQTDVRPAL